MAFLAKAGSFSLDATNTPAVEVPVTGVGFQPKIVLFFWSGTVGTGSQVGSGDADMGFGAAVSSTNRYAASTWSWDNVSTIYTQKRLDNNYCISVIVGGVADAQYDLVSMDVDGFTVIADSATDTAFRIHYLALGGSDLTNVKLGTANTHTAIENHGITGVGFRPDALLVFSTYCSSFNTTTDQLSLNVGFATASSAQGSVVIAAQHFIADSNTYAYGYNAEIIGGSITYGLSIREAFVSFDADGFTLNNLEGTTATPFIYVALKGGQYAVGELTTRTDGNDIAESLAFSPKAILFLSANRALSTQNVMSDHLAMSVGAASSASSRATATVWDEDAKAVSEGARASDEAAVYAKISSGDAIDGLMDLKSIDALGFTCVMDNADPSACWVTYLAIGSSSSVKPWYAYAQQ